MTTLTDADYTRAATVLKCDVPAIKAVVAVEASGSGYLSDGRPKVLYEAHVFHRLTSGKHARQVDRHGTALSAAKWDRTLYGAIGAHQHERLEDAAKLDWAAAHKACSWGTFQILGENHAACGFPDIKGFVDMMRAGNAGPELDAFVAFIQANRLAAPLGRHDWAAFARGYNGPGYRDNHYDDNLAAAWRKHGGRTA
jgi:hypothetical protein